MAGGKETSEDHYWITILKVVKKFLILFSFFVAGGLVSEVWAYRNHMRDIGCTPFGNFLDRGWDCSEEVKERNEAIESLYLH